MPCKWTEVVVKEKKLRKSKTMERLKADQARIFLQAQMNIRGNK